MKAFLLISLFVLKSAFALDVYNEHSSNVSARWNSGYSTIKINGTDVRQYPIDPDNCTKSFCAYRGRLDDGQLVLGDNSISFYVQQVSCSENMLVIHDTFQHYGINKDGKRINFFQNLKRDGKCPAKFNLSTVVNLSLEEIDYQLYLQINQAIDSNVRDLDNFRKKFQSSESDLALEKDKLDQLEKKINECQQIVNQSSDFSSLQGQLEKCENFKKAYDSLSDLIKAKEIVSAEARSGFNDGLQRLSNNISDFKYNGAAVLSPEKVKEIEQALLSQMPEMREQKAARVNFVANFALSIIEKLEESYRAGKRDEFIQLASYSEDKLNEFSTELAARNFSFAETTALKEATERINAVLAKYVDSQFWFNDLSIPADTKNAVDNVLGKLDRKTSIELKAALQKNNKIKAEAIKKGIHDALGVFNTLYDVRTATNTTAVDSFIVNAGKQFATFIKNDGLCLGARLALNDAADLFEFASGRDFCDIDRELSLSERAFAGLGLIIGSGEVWGKVAEKSKGVVAEASASISNFFKRTGKAGLKTEEEIMEYAGVIRSSQNEEHMVKSLFDAASEEASALMKYGPINPGPLHNIPSCNGCSATIADSFRSSSYFKVALNEDLILYRVQSKSNGRLGAYWSRIKPGTKMSSKIDLALLSEWNNAANEVIAIKIPKGSAMDLFEGVAGEQISKSEKLLGGGNQVFIKMDDINELRKYIIDTL